MSYKPKYLGHVNMYVRSTERSLQWYSDVLGLHLYDRRPGAAFMSADLNQSHEIALVEVGDDAAGPEKGRVGLNHMAWMMESLGRLEGTVPQAQGKERSDRTGVGPRHIHRHLYS